MNNTARNAILTRLGHPVTPTLPSDFSVVGGADWSQEECVARFRAAQESVNGEVYETTESGWPSLLADILIGAGAETLVVGTDTDLPNGWAGVRVVPFSDDMETFKATLFGAHAALTRTRGAVAATGSLILWPGREEPRTLSLVPPLHVALLREKDLYDTLHDAMAAQGWAKGMPTNALLVSGPSKTADIEQTLVYGVHGSKRLVTLVIRN